YRIHSITIIGNETTKDYIIRQELSLHADSLLTYAELKYDLERIYSLQLFTKVTAEAVPLENNTADLIIMVHERWYFYPYPNLGLRDRSWNKIYYGLGVVHTNFSGKNVRVFGSFALGYDPYVSLNYYDPLIYLERQISLGISGYYKKQRNRSLVSQAGSTNFDENQLVANVTVGKRFSLFSSAAVTLNFIRLTVSDNRAGRTLSPDGTDQYFSLNFNTTYDTRDLREYPRIGSYFGIGITKNGLFEKTINYQSTGIDLRRYIPIYFDMTIAGRVFGAYKWGGRIPNYNHVYFGYGDRIRGYFYKILEGEQQFGTTAEIHYPILKPRYVRMDVLPLEQFRDIRYAVNVALFADAGAVWYRTQKFSINKMYSGYGAGIHFLLAYSAVVRFEYAFPYDRKSRGEFIFDVGAAL
ncbi:MAG: BamA/TamA family outer membrane protein, partial [Bacteroidetes bacterium]|nr:BamA/TamA family outer membrane protein [Bacteroidota bacterium]